MTVVDDPVLQARRAADAALATVAVLAIPLTLLPPDQPAVWQIGAAIGLTLVTIALGARAPWDRLPTGAQLVPAFLYLLVVGFLRDAEGGAPSGFAPLVLLPLIWTALRGRAGEVIAVCVAISATLLTPIVLFGAPAYPVSEWRRLVIWTLLAPTVGLAVQYLVSRVEQSHDELQRTVRTDPLTSLLNRRGYEEVVGREVARAARTGAPLALAMIDIDHFKRFNDTHGHAIGDQLLVEAAAAWQGSLREVDVLARWGGEEFVAVLPECEPSMASDVAERLRAATPRGQTCSVGVAVLTSDEDAAALLERADAALYEAKRSGRDRVVMAVGTR